MHSGHTFERWYREEAKRQPRLLTLTREELMRHEAAGITTAAFPKTVRLGGVDCAATYLHEPGNAHDGVTVTLPLFCAQRRERRPLRMARSRNAQGQGHCACQDAAAAGDGRSRLVPLPDYAAEFIADTPFGESSMLDALAAHATKRTGLPLWCW